MDRPSLGGSVGLATTEENVYLKFNSDIDSLSICYTEYQITVKYVSVGAGSAHIVGSTACTMTIKDPTPSVINLDKAGTWTFDFELTMTTKPVNSDQATKTTITVNTESS
jgi:hypothetical protein